MTKKIRKAVLPAAGYATRFLPASKAMPKQMLPLVDKPVIQYIVEQLVDAGIEDIIIVTNYHERAIEDHFDAPHADLIENLKLGGEKKRHLLEEIKHISEMANFVYVRQKGPYGNGTPLLNVKHLIGNEPFIYAWSDEFFLSEPNVFKQMIKAYEAYGTSCLGCLRSPNNEFYKRMGFVGGAIDERGNVHVTSIIEKPGSPEKAPSNLATISPFLFTSDIFDYVDDAVRNTLSGSELYWNDVLKLMLEDKKQVTAIELRDVEYCDSGTKLDYLKTVVKIALKHPEIGEDFRQFLTSL